MPPKRLHRLLVPLVVISTILGSGCSGEVDEEPLAVTSVVEQLDAALQTVSMSAPWLSNLELPNDSVVLVPSDEAILSLDADALADLASEDIEGWVVSDPYPWAANPQSIDELLDSAGAAIETSTGIEMPLEAADGIALVAGAQVTDILQWNDSTLVVLGQVPDLE